MTWKIEYQHEDVEQFILELPAGLSAKYLHLTDLMMEFGANLGMPHTKPMSKGLFELRVKSQEGIARVFSCTCVGKRIIMLHGYIKKTALFHYTVVTCKPRPKFAENHTLHYFL